jgi:AAHS family 4-hydroxybenzoate transporter-like MFS transporter
MFVDVQKWIDEQKLGFLQILVFLVCGAATLLDGFDAQSIGYVAPAIIKDWHILPVSLSGVFSAGTFGILIGCLFIAPMADWFGRRWLVILSLTEFGVATFATAYVQSLEGLLALRFLTGIGLGACMSNAVALTSEFVPSRMRAAMTTWMFCGYPLGASLGGLVVANLSAIYGWRSVFIAGGLLPLLLAGFALLSLPESLFHLASRPGSGDRMAAVIRRFGPGAALPNGATLTNSEHRPGLTVGHLFRDGRMLGTVLLWVMFFLMLVEVFLLTSWTPTLLNQAGKSMTVSVLTMAVVQGGGVITLLAFGRMFDRLGFQVTLVPLLLAATLAIGLMGNAGDSVGLIMAFAFVAGAGVMGGQSSLIVLAAMFYPSFIRSTGVGWALGIGRLGAVIGPLLGGLMLSLHWSLGAIFLAASVLPLLTAIALLFLGRVSKGRGVASSPAVAD